MHGWSLLLDGSILGSENRNELDGQLLNSTFGERLTRECRVTVTRAGWLERRWTQLTGLLELTELYEVGFLPKGSAP